MRSGLVILLTVILALSMLHNSAEAADKKKKKKNKKTKTDDKNLFDSHTLRCLVCQNVVDEFLALVHKVDPKKMIETGTFRINNKGEQSKILMPLARSQVHLMEVVDQVCDGFDDYAQAKEKSTGKPTIIRLTTPEGNMNPRFSEVDLVPDDDLNTKLKFHCQAIVEDQEDNFTDLLALEEYDSKLKEEICVKRAKLCKKIKDEL